MRAGDMDCMKTNKFRLNLTYTRIIALSFFGIIIVGSLLLTLPVAARSAESTPYINSLFTAVSATCVTGLVTYDTFTHWSLFGQGVILCLIQIGGLGFMTLVTLLAMFLGKNIGLHERRLLMQSAGTLQIGGVVRLLRRIAMGTALFEGIGAVVLAIRFCPKMGFLEGVYNAVFHSVSAFCNAGFDLMGKYTPSSSFTLLYGDVVVNVTIMCLIILGGLGFIVWNDILTFRGQLHKYKLHSKIVIMITAILILGGAVLFFLFEYNHSLSQMSLPDKILASFFGAVTPRTAGFNTVDINQMSDSGSLLTMILMLIGGSPGSTAGGIKTTTFAVLVIGAVASARQNRAINVWKRRLEEDVIRRASAIFIVYLMGIVISTMLICAMQELHLKEVLFETISAAGTVGLSTGITSLLNPVSKILIMILMYGGRVGGLSLALALAERREHVPIERPVEKILIG